MRARRKRALLVGLALLIIGGGAWAIFRTFNQNMVFFYTPSQVLNNEAPRDRSFRMGGMVEQASLKRIGDTGEVEFVVTDTVKRVQVRYRGMLPDLFKEGKGVVVQGKMSQQLLMTADEVLAKHDENYMPPEAAYAMKKAQEAQRARTATP